MNEMNENLYREHKQTYIQNLACSQRQIQCIHVSSRKLKLPKDIHAKKYKQLLPTHPSQKWNYT